MGPSQTTAANGTGCGGYVRSARRALFLVLLSTAGAVSVAQDAPAPAPSALGFLCLQLADAAKGEAAAALELAGRLAAVTVLHPGTDGQLLDQHGHPVKLDRFGVVWLHQGDSTNQDGPLYSSSVLGALQKHVQDGRGLFLSGAALAMVELLGVEPVQPRRGGPGKDRTKAGLVPVATTHPVFAGLKLEDSIAWVSDVGYPAFSDFHASGGPAGGMLLARTPSGSENPLVEYKLGQGRIIAMGWRLPHYSNASNAHRQNLERLTRNIVTYLSDRTRWQKLVVTAPAAAGAPAREPTAVTEAEWLSLERAVRDLRATFGPRYAVADDVLSELSGLRRAYQEPREEKTPPSELVERFCSLRRKALLANPLLRFDRLLLIKRRTNRLGLPQNWQSNSSLPMRGYDNEIMALSPVAPDGELTTVFRPVNGEFVGDVDLHFDARRLLVSMPGANGRWQVFELDLTTSALTQLPLVEEPDVDNYDACYLPDGDIMFTSTAPFVGVPCVTGSSHVANLFRLDRRTGGIRQLTFDQDHDWCPTLLNNGRVLYLRWEYSDIPHFVSRILFHMNPDGTGQMEYYGSNSYWPNAMFYARPIPGHDTQFVAVVGGHHDDPRMGELVLFDVARGRHEADGALQRIPGYGQTVEPVILDGLVRNSWPKFLHPWPLRDPEAGSRSTVQPRSAGTYFLVAARPTSRSRWGIYLVDTFDNMVLLKELPGFALLEPVPLLPTPRPPIISAKVDTRRSDASVFMADVYRGPGLVGIPRGTVKKLRLVTYHFAYHGMGGQVNRVGLDGPWDVKRIVGTVPVEADGSALFRIPANTPISVQPLDGEGKALQLMRSWLTAMPGEVLSCVGCHEPQNTPPPARRAAALEREPSEIQPWYGPTRGFSFVREVQPVLDRYCVGCHDGATRDGGATRPDFRTAPPVHTQAGSKGYNRGTTFPPSYLALRRYVRSPTIESDMHLLPPGEFHADTAALVRLLRGGHHGVRLDDEAWDRLITWMDLHTPAHGTWTDVVGEKAVRHQAERRRTMMSRYSGRDEDPEAIFESAGTGQAALSGTSKSSSPESSPEPNDDAGAAVVRGRTESLWSTIRRRLSAMVQGGARVARSGPTHHEDAETSPPECPGWPLSTEQAKSRQAALGTVERTVDVGKDVALTLIRVPQGECIMGDADGFPNERPLTHVRMPQPFWLGKTEVTNRQFAAFDPAHDSRLEHGDFLQFSVRERGYPVNHPDQPVVRVSWDRAMAFCAWLSERTGECLSLPTEREWEYACRAGTGSATGYGQADADFAKTANLADLSLQRVDTFGFGLPSGAIPPWRPAVAAVDDGFRVSAPVGRFQANRWGLHDMHGNAAEWTRSIYRPYPCVDDVAPVDTPTDARMVVRGGSWYDRPRFARSASRRAHRRFLPVFDVGFRVVCYDRAAVASTDSPEGQ